MNTEQAYIEGFVKRASEYGFSYNEAIGLLKSANPAALAPFVPPQHTDDLGAALSTKSPTEGPTWNDGYDTMPENLKKLWRLPIPPNTGTLNSGTLTTKPAPISSGTLNSGTLTTNPVQSNTGTLKVKPKAALTYPPMSREQLAASKNDLGRYTR